MFKYTHGDDDRGFNLTAMGYDGKWRSTDQIPLRAVQDGSIDRFGFIDPTDGGKTHRYSLSGRYWSNLGPGRIEASVYDIDYRLDLFSNFTYATDAVNGDQFEQFDDRNILGTDVKYTQALNLFSREGKLSSGIQVRHDDISPVGLIAPGDRGAPADRAPGRSQADQLLRLPQPSADVDELACARKSACAPTSSISR